MTYPFLEALVSPAHHVNRVASVRRYRVRGLGRAAAILVVLAGPALATAMHFHGQFLLDDAGARPDQLFYFGESLGSAVVTGLAAVHAPAGLVLRSPFTDLASGGEHVIPVVPVRLLLVDRFPVIEQIRRVPSPTIVIYGRADRLSPPAQSEAVAAAAPHLVRRVAVPGADHNDPALADSEQIITALRQLAGRS